MAQRLPIPGSDNGTWGSILNGFLGVSLNSDGTINPTALTQAGAATLASPSFTGTPTAPTASPGTNTTQLATTAFTTTAVGALSGQYVPIMEGIVADGGVTDNSTVINNYLTTAAILGGQCPLLPAGFIGVASQIQLPAGVTLMGSGATNSPGGTVVYGTTLCPMKTGTPQTSVVDLANELSAIQDLNILGTNPSTGLQTTYAVTNEGQQCDFRNFSIIGGSAAALKTSSSALQCHMVDGDVRGEGGTLLTIDHSGIDWLVTEVNFANANMKLAGGPNHWVNCHFNIGPGGTTGNTGALIQDYGRQNFTSCYFDTMTPGGNTLIDRTNATVSSRYTSCTYVQNTTATVTGIPVFLETTTAGAGVNIVGGNGITPTHSSSFTYFVQGALTSTSIVGVTLPSNFLTASTMTDTQVGQFGFNTLAGIGLPSSNMFNQFVSVSTTPIAMAAQTLYTANSGSGTFDLPSAIQPGQIFGIKRGTLTTAITIVAAGGQSIDGGAANGSVVMGAGGSSGAQNGIIVLTAVSTTQVVTTAITASDLGEGWVFGGTAAFNGAAAFNSRVTHHGTIETGNYTTGISDLWIRCQTNSFTLTLGTTSISTGQRCEVTNEGSATTITMATATGAYFGPATIAAGHGASFLYDGTNWRCSGSY